MDSITCKLLLDGILGAGVDHLAFKWGTLWGPGRHKRSDHPFHTSIWQVYIRGVQSCYWRSTFNPNQTPEPANEELQQHKS